jgi:hypothetical protein
MAGLPAEVRGEKGEAERRRGEVGDGEKGSVLVGATLVRTGRGGQEDAAHQQADEQANGEDDEHGDLGKVGGER